MTWKASFKKERMINGVKGSERSRCTEYSKQPQDLTVRSSVTLKQGLDNYVCCLFFYGPQANSGFHILKYKTFNCDKGAGELKTLPLGLKA